jgi:hypothetical protein
LALSYWIDYLGFITEGKLAAMLITPSLGVPNWSVIYIINTAPSMTHIGRESSEEADNLANIGSKCLPILPGVFFEEIFERSVKIKPTIDLALATCSGANYSSPAPAVGTNDSSKETATVMLVKAVWTKPYLAYLI